MAKCLLSVYLLGEGNQMGVLTFISWERHIWTKLLNNSWLTKQLAIEETKWRLRMWKLRSCRTVSSLQPNFLKDTGLVRNHCNMQTILGKGCSSPALLSSPKAEAASPCWTFPLKIPTALLVYTVFLNTAFKGWRGVPLAAKWKSEQLNILTTHTLPIHWWYVLRESCQIWI